ncbi:unnamed protein product [Prorocentrum cordatum]|uniref:Tetratricopeptide repeat protein n=1 Tax=Prorocentrum cordatum TaxID=2364126 RepID=A0ABN9WQ53_9DINO|nr:unnamed protein product [Polarella glacialis]
MGEYQLALKDFDRVLQLKPRHFACLSACGMVYQAMGLHQEAADWFKLALQVHPTLADARTSLDRIERNEKVDALLSPRISEVTAAIRGETAIPAEPFQDSPRVSWDVHRELQEGGRDDGAVVYIFRANVSHPVAGDCAVRSLARFHVLRLGSGLVHPSSFSMDGSAEFFLEPGETYRFCWSVVLGEVLQGVAGGLLVERAGKSRQGDQDLNLASHTGASIMCAAVISRSFLQRG